MLVLTRKVGEEIVVTVGDVQVLIRLMDIDRNRTRIGVLAPPEVIIDRQEVHLQKQRKKVGASCR